MTADERPESRRLRIEAAWIVNTYGAPSATPERDLVRTTGPAVSRRRPRGIELHPRDWEERGLADFVCCKSELLVDDSDLDRVLLVLDNIGVAAQVADALRNGVSLVGFDGNIDDVLPELDARLGVGVATPNHVFGIAPDTSICPATEPEAPDELAPWPAVGNPQAGNGVCVAVVDTGFLQGWEDRADLSWLGGITEYDIDQPDYREPFGFIDPYAGHGTFVAGVARCLAPAAEVTVDGILQVAGVADEASIVRQIDEALAKSPDVINLSAGGYTRNNLPPKAFVTLWQQRLRHHKGVALVAAAGNDGGRNPFWPAAFPWAVSVGALTADARQRAEFSNYGGWVDVYAPGVDLVNAYCEGEYQYLLQPGLTRKFDGMCKWSGTSFSTPIVTGMIAARMSRTGENARQAADALLETARGQFLPGVGPRLLP